MVHLIQPQLIDDYLIAADRLIFGGELTPWIQSHASPWLTELMYIFYSSYYFILPGIGLQLYFRGGGGSGAEPPAAFQEYMLAVSLAFWVCYLHFLATPAGGPIFWPGYPSPVLHLEGGPITGIERWVFEHGTIVGG